MSHAVAPEHPFAALIFNTSVSSVKTLEEAKITKGCLYMQMPVQEVSKAVLKH